MRNFRIILINSVIGMVIVSVIKMVVKSGGFLVNLVFL